MSYGVSAALQAAVFEALSGDVGLFELVADAVFDAEPMGVTPGRYVSLGAERVRDRSDVSGGGAVHEFDVSVVTESDGFFMAKQIAARVSDVLVDASFPLTRGRLVSLAFYKAKAARTETGRARRIDLTFRARVQDSL